MFDELKVRVSKNKFATLSSDEANLVFEALDEAEQALRYIAPKDETDILSGTQSRAFRTLEKMEFISKRPIGPRKENVS